MGLRDRVAANKKINGLHDNGFIVAAKIDQLLKEADERLDQAIATTFTASDPIAVGRPTGIEQEPRAQRKAGKVVRRRKASPNERAPSGQGEGGAAPHRGDKGEEGTAMSGLRKLLRALAILVLPLLGMLVLFRGTGRLEMLFGVLLIVFALGLIATWFWQA